MITIKDVGRGAGISVVTVSRVHNNSRLVKEAKRRRFRTIADGLSDALNAATTSRLFTSGGGGIMSFHAFVRPCGRLALLAGILAAAPRPAAAQTTTGTIRGSVKSASGGALADAEVQAKNVATGVVRTASAHADGSYILVGLAPAFYDVSARRIGSAPQTRRVEVLIGATLSLDFTLAAGAVQLTEGGGQTSRHI